MSHYGATTMSNGLPRTPPPANEPVLQYAPGSPERATLQRTLDEMGRRRVEIPLTIDGRDVTTGRLFEQRAPHAHAQVVADVHMAGAAELDRAIAGALAARRGWAETPLHERLAIFLRAAELLAGRVRAQVNAATMLGQSKTAHQAEIDAACELVDFWRWNVHFAERIAAEQPASAPGMWNELEARPLEGFVLAVTPFNFTAIGGNLATAPAMMGNVVVWKPAEKAALSNRVVYDVLREAGLPDGVIQFLPGPGPEIVGRALAHRDLAGVHFTGSTAVFKSIWRTVGERVDGYRTFPRVVGETGGKDFIVAHPSAADDLDALAVAIVRGGYEFQGQKCSAASRVYVPDSLWPALRERLVAMIGSLRQGPPTDFRNFLSAVIDKNAFDRCGEYISYARATPGHTIVAGGELDGCEGWFVRPTLVETTDPKSRLMQEEIFGPIVTLYPYPAGRWEETLTLVDETSPYGLTGAVFARDRAAIAEARRRLAQAAGNFYVNDKPTGAVVGQQPFGGGRASGTNDKAGSLWNLVRWVSPRAVKETFAPPRDVRYPFMNEA
jgi:1-pyrroline-5-carboxylate dehydrogenase